MNRSRMLQSLISSIPNPEGGLTLTNTFAVGEIIGSGEIQRDQNVVIACDIEGLDGSGGGLIYEQGGTQVGCYVGFDVNGDFVAGHGQMGGDITGYGSQSTVAYIIQSSGQPSGSGTLVCEFVVGTPQTIRIWWNGVEVGTPVDGTGSTEWAGGDDGIFGAESSSQVNGGYPATAVSYTSISSLRMYENQTS